MRHLQSLFRNMSPARLVLLTFVFVAFLGTLLLSLPVAQQPGAKVSFWDALFTSVSAVCVTGLLTLNPVTTWSVFGKIVLLLLIQIGGIGLVTVFFYFMIQMGRKITLRNRLAIQAAFNTTSLKGMVRLITRVIQTTVLIEGIGALVLFFVFLKDGFSPWRAFGYGVFHSVSAFCNAGFDLIGNKSLLPYVTNIPLNLTLMILTIWGGIGFSVWSNLAAWFRSRLSRRQKRKERLSLHSRLALVTTGILIVVGALLFLVFEWNNPNTLGPLSRGDRVLASFFQSVTLRTTGFSTVEQTALTSPSILLSIVWFMIGGSPGGTAGGMKTVTISILICTVWATLKGKSETHVFGRTIPSLALRKALTIVTLFVGLAFGMTALLAITERSYAPSFFQLIFEVCSALATVGISQNLTPLLTIPGQIIIMVCMLIGRLGPISLVLALVTRHKKTEGLVRYSEEDVMIG